MEVLNVKHCTAVAHIKCSINTWVNDWGIAGSEGWGTWPEHLAWTAIQGLFFSLWQWFGWQYIFCVNVFNLNSITYYDNLSYSPLFSIISSIQIHFQ